MRVVVRDVSAMTNGAATSNQEANAVTVVIDKLQRAFTNLWSASTFTSPALARYAAEIILQETRRGILLMALLSMMMQLVALFFAWRGDLGSQYIYTCALLALLSLHVYVSAHIVAEVRLLSLLGVVLLIITATALMLLAHASGSLSPYLIASLVLLFMVMPLVPWGLREAIGIVALIYIMLTLSSITIPGRFDQETLWTLQFLILAAALIAVTLIARNVYTRKDDIGVRFDLESAHEALRLLSTRDPLTDAWNRRFLEQNFDEFSATARDRELTLNLALLDVDCFKSINDDFGHDCGDAILVRLAKNFMDNIPDNGHFIRLGGDEFAVLYIGDGCEALVERCLGYFETDPKLLEVSGGKPVTVSVGFATAIPHDPSDLLTMYRLADQELYAIKRQAPNRTSRRSHGGLLQRVKSI